MEFREVKAKASLKCLQPGELGEQLPRDPQGCASGTAMGGVMRAKDKPNTRVLWNSGAPPFLYFISGASIEDLA